MKWTLISSAVVIIPAAAAAQGGPEAAPPPAAANSSTWLNQWDGEMELGLGPAIGNPISSDADDDLVDDSEYEFAIRASRPLHWLGGLRFQLQAGVTSTPHRLDGPENAESGLYGEVEVGDSFLSLRRSIAERRLKEAGPTDNAPRPYGRYRFTRVYDGFLVDRTRDDQQVTLGLRYRRVPFVMCPHGVEFRNNDPRCNERGLYWEARAEVNRVWSTDQTEQLWNPKVQFDLYSAPFWRGTRWVFRVSGELNLFTDSDAPSGNRRTDRRLRIISGFDVSGPLQRLTRWSGIEGELLVRFQQRWSNDPTKEHTRLYAVPSVTLTVPFQ